MRWVLLLGGRADASVVRAGCDRAELSAEFSCAADSAVASWLKEQDFELEEGLVIARRVIDAGGRSRAYINGAPASVSQLRDLGGQLVDIHGQHAHQALMRETAQRALFDQHAGLTAQVGDRRAAASRMAAARTGRWPARCRTATLPSASASGCNGRSRS
jgi:DNA repair protein RecN (Recombination protein N)